MSETETRDAEDDGAVLRSIAKSIRPAFPEAADLLLGVESMHWPTEAHRQHEAASAARAEAQRLRHLLGSHADGHRCTCTELDPGKLASSRPCGSRTRGCPTHPDVDYIAAEVARLRAVVEAVQALPGMFRKMATDRTSRGEAAADESLSEALGFAGNCYRLAAAEVERALAVSSSGEAESGEAHPQFSAFRERVLADPETRAAYDEVMAGTPAGFATLLDLALGAYVRELTGLPIDFQVQRMTEANARHAGKQRNPLGGRPLTSWQGDARPTRRDPS